MIVRDGENDPWRVKIREIATSWLLPDLQLDRLPSNIILPFENPDLFEEQAFSAPLADLTRYRNLTLGSFKGISTGFLKSKFGAPAVAMVLDLLHQSRVKCIIGVGYCGSLRSNIKCGDLIVPCGAIRDEKTSSKYVDPSYPACVDTGLFRRAQEICQVHNLPFHSGLIWSTDAPLLETTKEVAFWEKYGAVAVDMETSALLTLARIFGISAAVILVASDNAADCAFTDPDAREQGMADAVSLAYNLATTGGDV